MKTVGNLNEILNNCMYNNKWNCFWKEVIQENIRNEVKK